MFTQIKKWALCAALAVFALFPAAANAGGKYALLIGNSDYEQQGEGKSWTKLPNPANDIALVGRSLNAIGFEVTSLTNGDWREMRDTIRDFSNSIGDADIVVFYFAGHGFEYGRRNYLVPVDASLEASADDIDKTFIEFEDLAERLYNEGTTIFMLDACRTGGEITQTGENGGAVTRSAPAPVIIEPATRQAASGGMREFDFEPGARVGVLYSTGRGVPAYDSAPPPENVSPFAVEVAEKVTVPRMDVSIVFNAIRDGVLQRTEGFWPVQVPFTYNSLSPNTFFTMEPAVFNDDPTLGFKSVKPPKRLRPINLSLEELGRIDEPILVMRVLSQHSVDDVKTLVAMGDPLATYILGYMQHFGLGVPKDLTAARATLEQAASYGTPYGQLELAYFLRVNAKDEADRARSLALYKAAAQQDYAKARGHYSRVLIGAAAHTGTPEYVEGVRQQRLAAEAGYAYAYYGLFYAVPEERDELIAALEAMAEKGRSDADQQLCNIFMREKQYADAMPHCEVAARAGYPDAFAHLALAAERGWTAPRSIEDARFWMRQALSRGDLEAGLCGQMMSMQIALENETGTKGVARIENCNRSASAL
ncbi:caspase family protein [Erythrobacter sp. SCSIO 43205]|uniref:caspase family protein n=1 Tax=Erythrobacter sp. SCSIO 43205 TaxID=2779361 RepID=UPI001CA889EE|nr:caspase family protein [Erythrobacter sp. SCSIO 43205]UAB79422.1 caspase family protein [Erythrobacter sp. SCSIO 43205]